MRNKTLQTIYTNIATAANRLIATVAMFFVSYEHFFFI